MPSNNAKRLLTKLNEPGGKLFECLTLALLEDIASGYSVKFQPRPDFMLIDPDIAITKDDRYSGIVLVTHSIRKNAAGVKIDRSLEELFQAKTRSPGSLIPFVVNFIWHSPSGWTPGQIARLDAAFDLNWVAFRDSKKYLSALPDFVDISDQIAKLDHEEAVAIVRSSKIVSQFAPELSGPITDLLKHHAPKHTSLWKAERTRTSASHATNQSVANRVKLDLTCLSMLPPSTLEGFVNDVPQKYDRVFDPAISSNALSRKSSIKDVKDGFKNGRVIMVDDLKARTAALCNALDTQTIERVLASVRSADGFASYRVAFESTGLTEQRLSRIRSALTAEDLLLCVKSSWISSDALFTGTCWPIDCAVALKQALGDRDFGLTTLQQKALGETQSDFRWNPFSWYVNGDKEALADSQLIQICKVLAKAIASIKKSDAALAKAVQDTLRKKIRRKKKANPLLWFVKSVLDSNEITTSGFPLASINRQCPFCEMSNLPKITGASRFHLSVNGGKKIMHILSSYSSTHKHKEYAVKSRLAFYKVSNASVVRDFDVQEVGILLDGEWSMTEVGLLENAGVRVFAIDDPASWVAWARAQV